MSWTPQFFPVGYWHCLHTSFHKLETASALHHILCHSSQTKFALKTRRYMNARPTGFMTCWSQTSWFSFHHHDLLWRHSCSFICEIVISSSFLLCGALWPGKAISRCWWRLERGMLLVCAQVSITGFAWQGAQESVDSELSDRALRSTTRRFGVLAQRKIQDCCVRS